LENKPMITPCIALENRSILALAGDDRRNFLQGLITQDIRSLSSQPMLYTLLLSPQGKILFDFFLIERGEEIWLDCAREQQESLQAHLLKYKLRAKITLQSRPELKVYAMLPPFPAATDTTDASLLALPDPRHPQLGSRFISQETLAALPFSQHESQRLALGIPESRDFIPDRSFPMEFGIQHLHGISYSKGCYIGQELIARHKTRGTLHKALFQIHTTAPQLPACGTPILCQDVEIGQIRSSEGQHGLALLRIHETQQAAIQNTPLVADKRVLTTQIPAWFSDLLSVV
jgi:folate-binding protein YgfZ